MKHGENVEAMFLVAEENNVVAVWNATQALAKLRPSAPQGSWQRSHVMAMLAQFPNE